MIKVGDYVEIQGMWCGIVDDVAVGKRTMLLVRSPKGAWRNQSTSLFERDYSEWLEYHPDAITLTDAQTFLDDAERYRERLLWQLEDLDSMTASS